MSRNVNQVIRAVLNSLIFLQKDFTHTRTHTHTHTHTKAQNTHKQTKIKKAAFNDLKKHLREKKSLICSFVL